MRKIVFFLVSASLSLNIALAQIKSAAGNATNIIECSVLSCVKVSNKSGKASTLTGNDGTFKLKVPE